MYLYALTEQLTQLGLNEFAVDVCNPKHKIGQEISKFAAVTSRKLTYVGTYKVRREDGRSESRSRRNLRLTKKPAIFQSPTSCVFITICINQANQFWGLKGFMLFFTYICKLLAPGSPNCGQPEPEPNRERALRFHAQFRFLFLLAVQQRLQ